MKYDLDLDMSCIKPIFAWFILFGEARMQMNCESDRACPKFIIQITACTQLKVKKQILFSLPMASFLVDTCTEREDSLNFSFLTYLTIKP